MFLNISIYEFFSLHKVIITFGLHNNFKSILANISRYPWMHFWAIYRTNINRIATIELINSCEHCNIFISRIENFGIDHTTMNVILFICNVNGQCS